MTFYTAVFTLFLVMDPLGNIPGFLALLKNVESKRRQYVIMRECTIAFFVLVFFLLAGKNVLAALGISQAALGISGGIILFLIALKMMFPDESTPQRESQGQEPFIVPLAVPLVAGPSSMAVVMLLTNQHPEKWPLWLGALAVASVVSTLILLFSDYILKIFGKKLLHAMERLMGMLLATMAVQMLLTGIQSYFNL
jgi:multiple antibiotic resistance protein